MKTWHATLLIVVVIVSFTTAAAQAASPSKADPKHDVATGFTLIGTVLGVSNRDWLVT